MAAADDEPAVSLSCRSSTLELRDRLRLKSIKDTFMACSEFQVQRPFGPMSYPLAGAGDCRRWDERDRERDTDLGVLDRLRS